MPRRGTKLAPEAMALNETAYRHKMSKNKSKINEENGRGDEGRAGEGEDLDEFPGKHAREAGDLPPPDCAESTGSRLSEINFKLKGMRSRRQKREEGGRGGRGTRAGWGRPAIAQARLPSNDQAHPECIQRDIHGAIRSRAGIVARGGQQRAA